MSQVLDENQRKAVESESQKLIIDAGPGSGKTRVLIERIEHFLSKRKINPESLLVITFTQKVAEELKNKLSKKFDINIVNKMQISTIHSFCYELLKENKDEIINVIDDEFDIKKNLFIRKNFKEFGFEDIYTLPLSEIRDLMYKFKEYSTFDVDSHGLISYIENNFPISQEYIDFVHSFDEFPRGKIREEKNKKMKSEWYNAKYLQIAKAYQTYLDLLKKNSAVDFEMLQIKALEYLNENPKTKYKNIFVDEFQATDYNQFKIFEVLMENCESFTAVGDIDQSIYDFRGASNDYFKYLKENHDVELIPLNNNYRSTNDIVKLTEKFIKDKRSKYSKKRMVSARNIDKNSYYITSKNNDEEGEKIAKIVRSLKDSGKIKNYSDIAILCRSIKSSREGFNTNVNKLIKYFNEYNVPYQFWGLNDLLEQNEIKSVIILIYYLTIMDNSSHIKSRWESSKDGWLNLKGLAGLLFKTPWNFSEDTKEYLAKLQDDYEKKVIGTEKIVYNEFTGKKSRISKFHGVFNRYKINEDILVEIFKRVENPKIDLDLINNQEDYDFFNKLNKIKESISHETPPEDRPSLLEVYYRLLDLIGYMEIEFIEDEENHNKLKNIAILTDLIKDYENDLFNKNDLKGIFWFLSQSINNFSSNNNSINGVNISTVHKAQGLEFPVVIVSSIIKDKFPSSFKDPNPENGYINGRPVYYTPNEFLKQRNYSLEEEMLAQKLEEDRIFYVALSRAREILILSTVKEITPEIKELLDELKSFDIDDVEPILTDSDSENDEEKLKLSYTSLKDYKHCPYKYNLLHNFGFSINTDIDALEGVFIHHILNKINKHLKYHNNEINKEDLLKILKKAYSSFKSIDNMDLKEAKENILYYIKNYSNNFNVIDSELPFIIENDDYILKGAIDLIYQKDDGTFGILDYKNSDNENKNIYKKQLYTYIIALSKNPDYKDLVISEAKIYSIKSKKLIDIEIDESELEEQLDEIEDLVYDILDENFDKDYSIYCENCKFNLICN